MKDPAVRIRQIRELIDLAQRDGDLDLVSDLVVELDEVVENAQIAAAREDPNAFIEYVFQNKDGDHLQQSVFHRQWQGLIHHKEWNPGGYRRAVIVAPRDHGKCVPDDGLVTIGDGSRVRAADLPDEFSVRSWSESYGWTIRNARKWRQHEQDVWKIKTRTGREERVSSEHPFLTTRGFVPISQLRVGDRVALCRGSAHAKQQTHEEPSKAWALGLLIGDGGLTQPSRVGVTISDQEILLCLSRIADLHGWKLRNRTPSDPGIDWSLSGRDLLTWLRGLGVHGHDAHSKSLPEACFMWVRESVGAIVAGYLEADGSVTDGASGRAVEFYSVSKRLLQDLQALLIRWDVQTVLAKKRGRYKGKPHKSWRLSVCGSSIDTLALLLDTRGPKARRLCALRNRVSNDSLDVIPDEVVDLIPGRFSRQEPRLDSRRKLGHQRWKVLQRTSMIDGDSIPARRYAQLAWDIVTEVKPDGHEGTWSIEVDDTHIHLVGDFVTHNTTQIPVGRALWELGRDPNLRIKIACQSDGKAMERLFEITDNMERNPRVTKVFPHLKPAQRGDWTKHKIVVDRTLFSKDASIEALGILSTATGGRADLLIADDVVDRRNALQYPQLRETIKHAWKSDWTNLLEPDGRVIYICTLWHTADNSHEVMNNSAYAVLMHSVSEDLSCLEAKRVEPGKDRKPKETIEPLWEAHWNGTALADRKEEIGSVEFNRAFRNIALSGEIIVVQPEWVRYFDPIKVPDWIVRYQGFDLAISKRAHADFFAVVTVGADPDSGLIYVLDAWHAKFSFTQQAQSVIREWLQHQPEEQVIESVAYQESLPQYLDSIAGKPMSEVMGGPTTYRNSGNGTTVEIVRYVPQLPIVRAKPRVDKMSRLKAVTPYLERGQVLFHPKFDPVGDLFVRERGDLVGELTQFPLASHDDLADAFVNAVAAAAHGLAVAAADGEDGEELDVGVRVIGV